MTKKRVVVEMPMDMVEFLEERANSIGVNNVSALLRMWVKREMEDTKLRTMVPTDA